MRANQPYIVLLKIKVINMSERNKVIIRIEKYTVKETSLAFSNSCLGFKIEKPIKNDAWYFNGKCMEMFPERKNETLIDFISKVS